MKMRRFLQWTAFFLLPAILVGWGALRALADPTPPPGDHFVLLPESSDSLPIIASGATGAPEEVSIRFSITGDQIWTGDLNPLPFSPVPAASSISSVPGGVTCKQFLINPQLDVLELGDGTGRAEPWVVLDPIVYYSNQDYVSPNYSLALVDADTTDPTPNQDAFAQAFYMPTNLVTVTIQYHTAMIYTNATDKAWGELWTVDQDGNLVTPLGGWEVGESPGAWQQQTVRITDPAALAPMAGQRMAIILFNRTDGSAPGEIVWFDDVTLTACVRAAAAPFTIYLPLVLRNFGSAAGPICIPPSENPQDTWNANRGIVQCNSTCQSTLSRLDPADYYTFVPSHTGVGNCTLYLRNLPAGTEWAAMIFVDQPNYPPPYAPGPAPGNQCRITTPGSGDKSVTCPLTGGTSYFVKVSAGAAYTGPEGSYRMQITCPTGDTPIPTPVPTPPTWTVVTTQDFEGAFPGSWVVYDGYAGYGEYYWGRRSCRPYAGSYSGWAVGGGANGAALSCGSHYPDYASSWMVYGPFSLVGATAAELRFKLWLNSEMNYDWFCVAASPDGERWDGPCSSGSTGGWVDRVLNLASVPTFGNLLGDPSVWVSLVFISDRSITRSEGAYVDNIVLRKCTVPGGGCVGGSALSDGAFTVEGENVTEAPASLVLPRSP